MQFLLHDFSAYFFSEGQKCENTNDFYVSISNSKVELHETVLNFLKKVLIHDELVQAYCYYNPNVSSKQLKEAIEKFENQTNLKAKPVKAKRYGKYNFNTNVNSTLFGEVMINGLNSFSKIPKNKKLVGNLYTFAINFILEVISGDGNLTISDGNAVLQVSDESQERRNVVQNIFKKLGLNPKDDGKLLVTCDISGLTNRFKVLNLNILTVRKKEKLAESIQNVKFFNLQMQRLEKVSNKKVFDNKEIRNLFNWNERKTTKWLVTMRQRGFIQSIGRKGHSALYSLNKNHENFRNYLKWKKPSYLTHANQNDLLRERK